MCPLRLILLFLSATLAGFFVLRNLKSTPDIDISDAPLHKPTPDSDSPSRSTKVCAVIGLGFWTCVDMASGKYLWRHLKGEKKQC
ncbi:hypothetical protein GIB67_010979 [Kingdonia uniflora]|uniref:Uncharacterized protein n=1 Tax=Kingdonia uniflora TaxID=39325 RepID=A0A7J7MM77_9MAGN|nr:hypothetical protein GIB67_010979 [Kingdonia uniflora]